MKFTKREIFLLKENLEFDIHRYLLSNDCNRLDGSEKADCHIEISKKIYQFLFLIHFKFDRYDRYWDEIRIIHDYLAEILTDKMDEVIGFPINTSCIPEIDDFAEKFFQIIIENLDNMRMEIKNQRKLNE